MTHSFRQALDRNLLSSGPGPHRVTSRVRFGVSLALLAGRDASVDPVEVLVFEVAELLPCAARVILGEGVAANSGWGARAVGCRVGFPRQCAAPHGQGEHLLVCGSGRTMGSSVVTWR